MANNGNNDKSLESWIWDAACSIRGAKDAPKYKEYILPLIFAKRLCDVFDDELNRIAKEVGSRAKAFKLVKHDKKLVRFFLPLEPKNPDDPVWSIIRKLADKIGEQLTTLLRDIADENSLLKGIIDRVDFNATTHGVRDLDDDRLSNLIERISEKRLGLNDVEADIIGRSYEYLIRKFAEGSVSSAGEFYTPKEVGMVMARILDPEPGMTVLDPCCGSAGLLIKCQLVLEEKMSLRSRKSYAPLQLYGQEYTPETWAMANMNMIIHDMQGQIEIGDSFKNPKFRKGNRLQTFDRIIANPMWNQDWWKETDYDNDELDRFPKGAGYPGPQSRLGLGANYPRVTERHRPRRHRPRHRRRLARLRQRQHEQRKRRTQMVRRAGPDRRRHLPAGKSFLQHHCAGHHSLSQQGQAEDAKANSSCSTPAASSPKATRKTICPTTRSCASLTLSNPGAKKKNSAASSRAKRSPKTTLIFRPAATFIPVKRTSTGRLRRSWRSWKAWKPKPKITNTALKQVLKQYRASDV